MSDFQANTDVMRNVAGTISKSAGTLSDAANRISSLNSQIGGDYQGQLRDKVGPILSGAIGDGLRLNTRFLEFSGNLNILASEIDKVMQLNAGMAINTTTRSTITSSPIMNFFNRVGQVALGVVTAILVWAGFEGKAVPVTIIPTKQTPTPPIQKPAETPTAEQLLEQERKERGDVLVKQYNGNAYANGTYNPKDSYSARPVNPPVTNKEGDRDSNIYNATLNQFGVETNPRYDSRNDNTYCNIYVWDATRAMGAEIPHWVDTNGVPVDVGKGRELNANGVVGWLSDHGKAYGWHTVTAEEAQSYANNGSPAVAVWANPHRGESGHVAMVRPGSYSASTGPTIAQAGGVNKNITTVSKTFSTGWSNNQVVYYVHN